MRQRRRRRSGEQRIEMTPMIDVVFLLLVFFVVTSSPRAKAGHFKTRSGGEGDASPGPVPAMILVEADGFMVEGRRATEGQLDVLMMKLAAISSKQRILVQCDQDSPHAMLVHALDACAGAGLTNVTVASSRGDAG